MIKTLPPSLLESASNIIQSSGRVLRAHLVTPLGYITSLHSELRNNSCPFDSFPLNESSSEFHQWAMETEVRPTKLPIDAYLRYGNEKDNRQMAELGMSPMTHPELFAIHSGALTPTESSTVSDFSHIGLRQNPPYSSGSMRINTHLIGAHEHKMQPNPFIRHHNGEIFDLHAMDSSIGKSRLPNDLVTYSGVGFDPSTKTNQHGIVESPSFLSTSTRRYVAGKYALANGGNEHHILKIHHSVGDHGIYVGNRTHLSMFSDDEYILPRGILLKLGNKEQYRNGNHVFNVWSATRHNQNQEYSE